MDEGCPTNMGQLTLGLGCEAEAELATVPIMACGILQWLRAAGCLPLPVPASSSSSSSSTPGGSVGTSSRFSLSAGPATGRDVKTLVRTWPVGTAQAQSRLMDGHPAGPSSPAPPQAPGAHGSARGSPPALRVPVAAPWLQKGC